MTLFNRLCSQSPRWTGWTATWGGCWFIQRNLNKKCTSWLASCLKWGMWTSHVAPSSKIHTSLSALDLTSKAYIYIYTHTTFSIHVLQLYMFALDSEGKWQQLWDGHYDEKWFSMNSELNTKAINTHAKQKQTRFHNSTSFKLQPVWV